MKLNVYRNGSSYVLLLYFLFLSDAICKGLKNPTKHIIHFVVINRQPSIRDIVIEGLTSNKPVGLEVVEVEGKGLGVIASQPIPKQTHICM